MKKYWWLIVAVLLLAIVAVAVAAGVGGFLLGDVRAVKGIHVADATPHELAEAMKADSFYSDYRTSALLVKGTVTSVERRGGRLFVGFRTDSSYALSCDLGATPAAPQVGQTFTVLAVGQAAERLPAGVLLHDCVVP